MVREATRCTDHTTCHPSTRTLSARSKQGVHERRTTADNQRITRQAHPRQSAADSVPSERLAGETQVQANETCCNPDSGNLLFYSRYHVLIKLCLTLL